MRVKLLYFPGLRSFPSDLTPLFSARLLLGLFCFGEWVIRRYYETRSLYCVLDLCIEPRIMFLNHV